MIPEKKLAGDVYTYKDASSWHGMLVNTMDEGSKG
jgi:hypothetical protein